MFVDFNMTVIYLYSFFLTECAKMLQISLYSFYAFVNYETLSNDLCNIRIDLHFFTNLVSCDKSKYYTRVILEE